MKTHPITLHPPAPATRLAIAAFHLRERRLRSGLAVLTCAVLSLICGLLCLSSTDHLTRAVCAGISYACAAAGGLYAFETHHAHRRLKRTEEGLR